MSYDLRVWEQREPLPKTFEAAAQTLFALEKAPPVGVNPKFVELGQRMARQYPVYDRDSDMPREDAVWLRDPGKEAQTCGTALWHFEIPSADRVGILRFIVDNANELGLTVFDDQIGMAFLPGGKVLPPEQAKLWESATREMDAMPERLTAARLRKIVEPQLALLLQKYGFKPIKNLKFKKMDFVRYFDFGRQRVIPSCRDVNGNPRLAIEITSDIGSVNKIIGKIFPKNGVFWGDAHAPFYVGTLEKTGNEESIEEISQVRSIFQKLEEKYLPILDEMKTLSEINRIMNDKHFYPLIVKHPSDSESLGRYFGKIGGGGWAAIVIGWLMDSPKFEEAIQLKRNESINWPLETRDKEWAEIDRVITYLRENVKRDGGSSIDASDAFQDYQ